MSNDPDLMISAYLVNVLILADPADTPWTNTTLCGVPGVPTFKSRSTILANLSATAFANAMNSMNLNISYDYAIAFMK